jgi:hypothetical protein
MSTIPIALLALNPMRFQLGQIALTANAAGRLDTIAVHEGLRRHASGDWGDLCPEDAALNDQALIHGGRLFSAYGTGENRFWVITEADYSSTTILMLEDY